MLIFYATVVRVLPPRFARRQIVGRILNMNFVHRRPPLDIHVSTAACPNIRVWTFLELNRIPSISKLQTYHIFSEYIYKYMHLHSFAVCMNVGCRLWCSWPSRCAWWDEVGAKQAGLGELLQAGKIQMKWSRSKVSRKGRLAPSRKDAGGTRLE